VSAIDGELTRDGRTVAYRDYGPDGATPAIWCHGGPGSRFEPASQAVAANAAGYRFVGIDRPGYGRSSPWPGRSIADWVPDGVAVADALGLDQFRAVGVSTGGAYALALAAAEPGRVTGVVACCALTDMRWPEGRASMQGELTHGLWGAPDRDAAITIAASLFGEDGSGMLDGRAGGTMAAPDLAFLADPEFLATMAEGFPAMFAQGVTGYADDRLADGVGWVSFDVDAVHCPVVVLHGELDGLCPVVQAHHTARIVPKARLDIRSDHGHLSIMSEVVGVLQTL
jgi:pimeloyl-ACP methyl ester carboxylesterase